MNKPIKETNSMTFVDLFAGVGGFRRGLELAGHKCVGFCEYDNYAVASYTSMHLLTDEQREKLSKLPLKQRQKEILKEEYRNGEWYAKDIKEVTGDSIPKCDLWAFGAPCQDFSIAGARRGLDGDRSSLVREVFRILSEQEERDKPEWIVYENVKGMLSSNGGRDFASILLQMEELGYDSEYFLFNSKYHGVPQNRERVYLIGHLRSRGGSKVLSLSRTNEENSLEKIKDKSTISDQIPLPFLDDNTTAVGTTQSEASPECVGGFGEQKSNGGTQFYQGDRVYDGNKVATSLTSQCPGGANYYTTEIHQIGMKGDGNRENPSRFRVYSPNGVGAALTTMGGGGLEPHTVEKININTDELNFNSDQVKLANYPFGNQKSDIFGTSGVSRTLAASDYKQPPSVVVPVDMFGMDKGVEAEEKDVANTLTAREDRGVSNHKSEGTAVAVPFMYDDYNSKFRDDHITGTLTPNTGSKTFRTGQKVCIPVLTPDRLEKRQNGRRFKEDGDPSFTLTAQDKHGIAVGIDDLYANRDEEVPTLRGERSGVEVDNKIDIEGNYMPSGHEAGNIMNPEGISATVRENHGSIQAIPIPLGVLRNVRSEYGKEIRKDYENGSLDISRHEFLEKEIREDGVSNTIDSVAKDNLVAVETVGVQMSGHTLKENDGTANCLNANDQRKVFGANQERTMAAVTINTPTILGNAYPSGSENGNIYDENSISPTLKAGEGITGNGIGSCNAPKVAIKEATTKGYAEAYEGDSINLEMPESNTRRGRVGHQVAQTLTTSCNQATIVAIDADEPDKEHPGLYIQLTEDCLVYAVWYEKYQCYIAIRKLTPKECFRLQGWSDEYFERAQFVNTDSQLYKQAGNGVTVNVVYVVGQKINTAMGIE